MSKISKIRIKNYLGIEEMEYIPKKINVFEGEEGTGKTSILDAIEKAYTNQDRRTKGVRLDEEEAVIFIEQDDGLSIDRKIRTNKSDYLKLRENGQPKKSTETEIRKILNGDIFRPLDWVKRDVKEQTESILKMISIDWTKEDIKKWFGEVPQDGAINYSQHILQLLKDIEKYYFDIRTEVNRKIRNKNSLIQEITEELPDEYNGEKWRKVKLSKLYKELNEMQELKRDIINAKEFVENVQDRINSITLKYIINIKELKEKNKNTINPLKEEIETLKTVINNKKEEIKNIPNEKEKIKDDLEYQKNIKLEKARQEYEEKCKKIKEEIAAKENKELKKLDSKKDTIKTNIQINKDELSDIKHSIELKKSQFESELKLLKKDEDLEKEKIREILPKKEELSNKEIPDIEDKREEVEKAEHMKSYLRTYDNKEELQSEIDSLRKEKIKLTQKVEKARNLPSELLSKADCPIDGISVDEEGQVLVKRLPIDNLSSGEKENLALNIAKQQAGELKIICIDGFNNLSEKGQNRLLKQMEKDEYQYFITHTVDGDLRVNRKDGENE